MTENEAINNLACIREDFKRADIYGKEVRLETIDMGISALKEIKQYRAIGTVEEIQGMQKEEDILKFYYCESRDEYYIGKRIDTMYYAKYSKTGFTWFMSRFLPWGKHVVSSDTFGGEHTYPSEPIEISFFEWLQGFIRKECFGTVEECRKAANVRKDITEIVNRQLIAGKNNYKYTNDCFYEIAKVVQSNYRLEREE